MYANHLDAESKNPAKQIQYNIAADALSGHQLP